MAAPIVLPDPTRLTAMRAGSTDVRSLDMRSDLSALAADPISSVSSVTIVARDDGAALTPKDLHLVPGKAPAVDTDGFVVSWWQSCDASLYLSNVTVDYQITVTVQTNAGRTIIADALQLIMTERS